MADPLHPILHKVFSDREEISFETSVADLGIMYTMLNMARSQYPEGTMGRETVETMMHKLEKKILERHPEARLWLDSVWFLDKS